MQPHVTVPAGRLYWAVLDPRPLGRSRIADAEMGFLFEDSLPVPIESVHTRYRRLPDGRVAACGIGVGDMDAFDRTRLLSVTPDHIPGPVRELLGDGYLVEPADLNLLFGPYEPIAVRTVRRRTGLVAASLAVASVALVAIGVLRRGQALDRATVATDGHRAEILRAAYPERAADGTVASMPPELRLLGEVRRLASTRSSELPAVPDAAPALASILAAWPDGVGARCDGITVGERSATVRGIAQDSEAVTRLDDAYRNVPGWTMPGSVQFTQAVGASSFTISLVRSEADGGTEASR
jgi:hypothetical protein